MFSVETNIYIVMEVLIGFVAVVGNAMVCYIILQKNSFRKKPIYCFILSLAIADLFVGLVVTPFAILTKLGYPHNNPVLCIAMITFIVVPVFISVYNLTAVSIERYLAIRFPILHKTKVNMTSSRAVVAVSWIIGIIIGLLPLLGWNTIDWSQSSNTNEANHINSMGAINSSLLENQNQTLSENLHECQFVQVVDPDFLFFIFLTCGLVPLSVCGLMYMLIYEHIKTIRKRLKTTSAAGRMPLNEIRLTPKINASSCSSVEPVGSSGTQSTVQTSLGPTQSSHKRSIKKLKPTSNKPRKREVKVATVLGFTVLGFAICWFPLHILNTIVRFSPVPVNIPLWVFSVAILLSHANSAINIFLYSWRIEAFRRELKQKILNKVFSYGR